MAYIEEDGIPEIALDSGRMLVKASTAVLTLSVNSQRRMKLERR
jgi:hypothetical protein